MYARTVSDRTLTFQVSGMLWNRSLVMRDRETKTLWSHLLGRGMRGPLEGEELEIIPAIMTDWKTWRTRHPRTTVAMLSRTANSYRREFYQDPSRFVLGLVHGGRPYAWPFDALTRSPVVNDTLPNRPILVIYLSSSSAAQTYDRVVDGRELTFSNDEGRLVDGQTGSQWDPVSGAAIDGPLKGSQLTPLPAIISYRAAWLKFHPNTRMWRPK